MYCVYVLKNERGRYYIGHTQNILQRLEYHNKGKSNWAGKRGFWLLCYKEQYATRAEAMGRERQLKSWKSKLAIKRLVEKEK